MHGASTHLATEHRVLRLSNFPFRHELGGAVGHGLDRAFGFREIVAATSDTDIHGVMDVRGLCGYKSESSCSHGGCTKQLPEHCSSLFVLLSGVIAGPPEQRWLRPIDAGNGMNFSRLRAIEM
jgi:hypothetical protein